MFCCDDGCYNKEFFGLEPLEYPRPDWFFPPECPSYCVEDINDPDFYVDACGKVAKVICHKPDPFENCFFQALIGDVEAGKCVWSHAGNGWQIWTAQIYEAPEKRVIYRSIYVSQKNTLLTLQGCLGYYCARLVVYWPYLTVPIVIWRRSEELYPPITMPDEGESCPGHGD
jgi:hypothetical protein